MKDELRRRASDLIGAFKDRGHCDFVNEFSERYPIFIVLDLLGLPQERMAEFLVWEKEMLHTNDWQVRSNAVRQVVAYLQSGDRCSPPYSSGRLHHQDIRLRSRRRPQVE